MYVKDAKSTLMQNAGKQIKEIIDAYVLGMYNKVAVGQVIGTNYTTGTVAVAATTGVVTGVGTTFTASMVGKGFKALGHTKYYRVKTYTSALEVIIEDDKDDEVSAYTGGSITAGATYVIEANTAIVVTAGTIYSYLCNLKTNLDNAKVPSSDRTLTVSPDIGNLLIQADKLTPAIAEGYDVIKKGLLGAAAGFKIFQSTQVAGNNTTGYWIIANHKSWNTFAMAYTKSQTEVVPGQAAEAYLGIYVYGAKVVDSRRTAASALFCRV